MWNMFRCELKKLFRCRAFYFLVLASAGCGALSVWVLNAEPPQGSAVSMQSKELLVYGYYAFASAIGECGIEIIIGALFAGIFICSDFENRTISLAVSAGNSRMAVLTGKILAFYLAAAVLVLPYPIISGIAATATAGFGTALTGEVVLSMIRMLVFKVIISSAMLTLCVLLCFWIKKSGASAAAGILILMGGQIALSVGTGKEDGIMDAVYRYSPVGLLQMISQPVITAAQGLTAIAVSAGIIAVLIGITGGVFRRAFL